MHSLWYTIAFHLGGPRGMFYFMVSCWPPKVDVGWYFGEMHVSSILPHPTSVIRQLPPTPRSSVCILYESFYSVLHSLTNNFQLRSETKSGVKRVFTPDFVSYFDLPHNLCLNIRKSVLHTHTHTHTNIYIHIYIYIYIYIYKYIWRDQKISRPRHYFFLIKGVCRLNC